jgi:hypothetical protein
LRGVLQQIKGNYEFRNENGTLFVLKFPLITAREDPADKIEPKAAE